MILDTRFSILDIGKAVYGSRFMLAGAVRFVSSIEYQETSIKKIEHQQSDYKEG